MFEERKSWRLGGFSSLVLTLILVLGAFFFALLSSIPNARAGYVDHTVGNLDVIALTDWGSLGRQIHYGGVPQIVGYFDGMGNYNAMAGLIFDQANYNHGNPDGLADYFGSGWGLNRDPLPDFNVTALDTSIYFEVDDGTTQKSYTTFTQVNSKGTIGVMNDVRIHQTAWTVLNQDWAVIEWKVQNIWGLDLTGVNVAFGAEIADPLFGLGPGGDGNDDIDNWDMLDSIYYVQDDLGTGDVLGFASASPSNPFNHYYADDVNVQLTDDDVTYLEMTGPSAIVGPPGGTRIASILSWNGYTIPAGSSLRFAMVIAFGNDVASMKQAVTEAQNFYAYGRINVQITEFRDASSANQRIEVYNDGDNTIDLSSWEFRNMLGTPLTGTWVPDANIPSGEHRFLGVTGGTLDPEGDIINLYNETGILHDSVGYGFYGPAPDPLTSETSSRVWNTTTQTYSDEWALTLPGLSIPSFGTTNNVPLANKNPSIVLNEVLFHNNVWEKFIELRFVSTGSLDITNYKIVVDSIFDIPSTTITDAVPYYYISESTPGAGALFTELSSGGDNVYLYDDTGAFLDMVGWNSTHVIDNSVKRVPEGNGTYDGYDDISSVNAGWQFSQAPSMPLIMLETDQTKYADINTSAAFNLTITNLKNDNDVVDVMTVSSVPNGWTTTFYTGDGSWTPLTDTDIDGNLDIGIMKPLGLTQYESINITVNVSLPLNPVDFKEFTTIGAQSDTVMFGFDIAVLTTEASSYIKVTKTADPKSIFVPGMGSPDRSTVTVNLTGAGTPRITGMPQDTVFAIDVSGSMSGSDPGGLRITGVKDYVDKMDDEERAAIVGFGMDPDYTPPLGGAWLTQDLFAHPLGYLREAHHFKNTDANNISFIKQDADSLNWDDGGTNIEAALQIAIQEISQTYVPGPLCNPTGRPFPPDMPGPTDGIRYGYPSHSWNIILLTDGAPSHSQACTNDEITTAISEGITIYTIGLGIAVDDNYLNNTLAVPTGGEYVWAQSAANISDAYERIGRLIKNVAGTPITIPPEPMIADIVPSALTVDVASINPAPSYVGDDGFGNTAIHWDGGPLVIGESWIGSYDVSCSAPMANQNVTLFPFATVNYLDWDNKSMHVMIPSEYINCFSIMQPYISNVAIESGAVNVTWVDIIGAEYYEIYGGPSQTALNLDSMDILATVSAPKTWWLDSVRLTTNPNEYYYVVRAVDFDPDPDLRSATSNTAGYYLIDFESGLNTFSLPLQPFTYPNLDYYLTSISSATSISWNDIDGNWQTYPSVAPPQVEMGKGYVIDLSLASSFVFTGEPSSMIIYQEGFGFDSATQDDIIANVDSSGNVDISWTPIVDADKYYVYRSNIRDGFFTFNYNVFEVFMASYQDVGAASSVGELYYLIVPYNSTQGNGSSTYSIGVITTEYNGNEMIGLPLKPIWGVKSADWYVDQIPNCLGIVYLENGIWKAHFKEFKEGVYDTTIEHGRGYELTVYDTSIYSFVGW